MTRPLGHTVTLQSKSFARRDMRNNTRLKIGEFSRIMQVTVKTLRYYEQIRLLMPAEVDEATGYRYYALTQMQHLNSIRRLKNLGFSLDEICELYSDSTHFPTIRQLNIKIRQCEERIKELVEQRKRLIDVKNSRKTIRHMEKFSIQSLPAVIVATHREVIPSYEHLGALCVNVIGPEMQRLGCQCTPDGYCFTIEHNKEYKPENIDIEYCEAVLEKATDSSIIKFKELPEVPKALCMKHHGPYSRFYESYTEAFKYIEDNGLRTAGQARTVYVDGIWNQEDPEKWLSIIQIPVE